MEAELRRVLDQATSAFQAGDYETAEPLLVVLADRLPVYANVHNMLGIISSHRGLGERAVEQFRRALAVNPGYTEAQLNLVITLADMGVYDQAMAEYRKAQDRERPAVSPVPSPVRDRLANAHADLGRLYHELRLYDHAVVEFDKALTWAPRFADTHVHRSRSLVEKGVLEEAARGLLQALEINPRYIQAYLDLGLVLMRRGQRREALQAWEKALALDPENRLARIYLRQAEERQGPSSP
jgi:tetratricopeptide (TPR) repeat protein